MSRLQIYIAGSAILAKAVLLRAYLERPNFYSAAVYVSQSTGSLMFLINLALIVMASIGYGLQRLFYGPLRPIETEQLYDKGWFAVSETLLAMTIFRDDLGLFFFTMFLCLLAGKVWQWIAEGRVEFLEQQPPANPKLFHTRLMSSLVLSVAFDIFMMQYCIHSVMADPRAGVMVMFGFEYVLLTIASASTLARYGLTLIEIAIIRRQEMAREEARRTAREHARLRAGTTQSSLEPATGEQAGEVEEDDDDGDVPGWEEKGRWLFYLDLATDFNKFVVYLGFFTILMLFYGLPIHIMRDLYLTSRSLYKRIVDFLQYRHATRDMNERYPDATAEELAREDTCIVCREEMRPWVQPGPDNTRRVDERQRPKKLPCGHILHFSCLRSWLERQQVCPTCRRSVLDNRSSSNNAQNQANPGQVNPVAPAGAPGLQGLLPGNLENVQQPGPVQPGQPAQPRPAPLAGPQNQQPQGNLRVFNFGPIRIALGNLRLPPNQAQNANNANNNNELLQRIAQQVAPEPNQNLGPNQTFTVPQLTSAIPGAIPQHPADIQLDILRLQQNIVESVRQLSLQHAQLENIHALLSELNRLQQGSTVLPPGQGLPPIAPLNTQYGYPSMTPQAYFTNGPVLRQGDAGVPNGLVLPEGWTLRPMALAQRENAQGQATRAPPPPPSSSPLPPPPPPPPPPMQSTPPTASSSGSGPSSKPAEPSSLESSWSFGNVGGNNEAEGSSSAVAGSSSESQSVTRRTVTVEDAEDEE